MSSLSSIRRLVPSSNSLVRVLSQLRDNYSHESDGTSVAEGINRVLNWTEYKSGYDPTAQFNVISFNVLAPVYKRLQSLNVETGNRKRESQNQELWRARATKTLQFFRDEVFPCTDILGMQEFWTDPQYRKIFDEDFEHFGYDVRVLQRTGSKLDAVVLAVKKDVFEVLGSLDVVLCSLSDRVALVLWLKHRATGKSFLVANTHLSFPHSALDKINQLRQMASLTTAMDKFAVSHNIENDATRMIMGDFNVECTSRVCEHLRSLGYISCFEVSTPSNARLIPHSLQDPPTSPTSHNSRALSPKPLRRRCSLRFVSHRNHRNEELGVDHIFVRAANTINNPLSKDITNSTHDLPHSPDPMGRSVVSSETATTATTSDTQGSTDQAQNIDYSSDHHPGRVAGARIFVDNSRVLPLKVPCTEWETTFRVSDHRPVGATLILAHPKPFLSSTNNQHHRTQSHNDHHAASGDRIKSENNEK